ncbi:MAG: glycosyltransferase family 4 protein [Patescibacteria group bacterium]
MKILSLSLDKTILTSDSPLARRTILYGELVDKYLVVVPGGNNDEKKLSEGVNIFSSAGKTKIIKLLNIYSLAKKIIKKENINVITVQDPYFIAYIGWRLAKKYKVGLEVQVHGFEKYFGLRKIIAKFILPRADSVRVVSKRLESEMVKDFKVRQDRITVVPIYSDAGIRNREAARLPMLGASGQGSRNQERGDKFAFLTVGRLVEVKNIGMQLRAFKNLDFRFKNLELQIIGSGKEERNLKLEITNLGLEEKVKFFGWQNDLSKFYNQADVFVLTSNYEGWGLAVIEAASYGLPIIMTDVGCAGEVIKNNESGIVIPVGDIQALEKAMIKLINNKDLRLRLGDAAKQAVKKLPSLEETLKLYKESWEKAINNPN